MLLLLLQDDFELNFFPNYHSVEVLLQDDFNLNFFANYKSCCCCCKMILS